MRSLFIWHFALEFFKNSFVNSQFQAGESCSNVGLTDGSTGAVLPVVQEIRLNRVSSFAGSSWLSLAGSLYLEELIT